MPNPSIPRVVPGHEPKQRPRSSKVEPQKQVQADNVYQTAHVGEIIAEMVRPNVSGPTWGGYDVEKLLAFNTGLETVYMLPKLHRKSKRRYTYTFTHINTYTHLL